jgi:MYXO-CTERM domain-containing protein
MNRTAVLSIVAIAGGIASSAMAQSTYTGPNFTVAARWVAQLPGANYGVEGATSGIVLGTSVGIPATGATAIVLTLQGNVSFGTFAANTSSIRYGNFGISALGFGPGGATDFASITRSGNFAGTAFERGSWGSFVSAGDNSDPDNPVPPTVYGQYRGAAPGTFNGTNNGGNGDFARGFRFWNNTDGHLDDATGNVIGPGGNSPLTGTGNGSGNSANGFFNAGGDLINLNLARTDISAGSNTFGLSSNTAYVDLYRVLITSTTPMIPGGSDLTINFNGFLRGGWNRSQSGSQWLINSTPSVAAAAGISFGLVPTPGAAALVGLAGLAAGRRRR